MSSFLLVRPNIPEDNYGAHWSVGIENRLPGCCFDPDAFYKPLVWCYSIYLALLRPFQLMTVPFLWPCAARRGRVWWGSAAATLSQSCFFLAATVIKFVVLDQHVTSGAFPLLTLSVLLHVRAIPCPASVKSLLPPSLHSYTALPWPCDGKIDQEILLGMCVWSLSPTTVVCEIRKYRADMNHLICLRAKKCQPLRRPPGS